LNVTSGAGIGVGIGVGIRVGLVATVVVVVVVVVVAEEVMLPGGPVAGADDDGFGNSALNSCSAYSKA
jgi:hypothetical protein